jgi:MtN3 and saliva related transmembrane protein
MTMMWEIWGILAGLITASGYVPQIIKGYKTKRLEDLSYLLNILMGFGLTMWLVYGIAVESIAIILTNLIGIALNLTLILMKYHYSRNKFNS